MSWFQGRHNGRHAALSTPLARSDELVVEDIGDEVLVYDRRTDQAHCLSRDAAMVWRVCDGRTSAAELASALSLEVATIERAIEELDSRGLLDSAPVGGITRREATIRMAKAGGVAAAAPLIYSIMAPTPALAASQNFCINQGGTHAVCFTNGSGCATCFKLGCACCGEGTSGGSKLCTSDCSPCFCTASIIHAHCGGTGTSSGCTSGPNHLPTTC